MEKKNCPCCGNNCPEDDLSCGRGRRYFGQDGGDGNGEREHGGHAFAKSSDEVVNLLMKIGHTLHHSRGGGEIKLDCLTDDERVKLKELLNKCLSALQAH